MVIDAMTKQAGKMDAEGVEKTHRMVDNPTSGFSADPNIRAHLHAYTLVLSAHSSRLSANRRLTGTASTTLCYGRSIRVNPCIEERGDAQ